MPPNSVGELLPGQPAGLHILPAPFCLIECRGAERGGVEAEACQVGLKLRFPRPQSDSRAWRPPVAPPYLALTTHRLTPVEACDLFG
jgi:hypothetical protein